MTHKVNTFLTIFVLLLFVFGGYIYFSNALRGEAESDSLASSADEASAFVPSTPDSKIAQDTAFLSTLTSLTKIKIDTSLFANKAFMSLRDNEVVIEPVIPGRANPFASLDTSSTAISTNQVVTNQAANITATVATLHGALGSTTGATSGYFEYGLTKEALSKTTAPSPLSLVGAFNVKVTGLTPKTQYFFRAGSRVSGVTLYGEVLSFTTN
jgi:hypothetical protein